MKHLELLQLNKTPCFKRANYVRGCCCYSVAKLQPHGLQHARLPCQSANSRSLFKLMSIELTTPSNHLILCRPLLLPPSIFPSIRVFSNEWVLRIRWTKNWSFSFSISPSKEHPGLISFRMDWLHLLAVQGTLKSLLQHHSSKASILRRSAFFTVQLSHPYMTTGKTIALIRRTFVDKLMFLYFSVVILLQKRETQIEPMCLPMKETRVQSLIWEDPTCPDQLSPYPSTI